MLRGKGRRGTPLSGGMCAAHFLKPFQAQSKNQFPVPDQTITKNCLDLHL